MALYTDQIKKIEYYRSRIIQDLTRQGIYPDDERIASRISNIDTMLGTFQYVDIGPGELFDTYKFNEDMIRIMADLKILYELAYEISVKDYEELQLYCETHLTELQNMANNYRYKTQLELDSTYLGNTIFYQSTGFDMTNDNGVLTVKLGNIETQTQAKLACIFESDMIADQDVIFSFKNSDGAVINGSPYSYNKDFVSIPGSLRKRTYKVSLYSENIRTSFVCTPALLSGNVNYDNQYIIFGGEGFITTGYYTKSYAEKLAGVPIELSDGGIITFFLLDASYANFEFSATPDNTNFQGTSLTNLPHCQKIYIEHSDTFSCDFVTDGTIYATRQKGRIVDGELIYPAPDQIGDLLIEEYSVGSKISYNVSVTANIHAMSDIPVIKAIAIKQISALEDMS